MSICTQQHCTCKARLCVLHERQLRLLLRLRRGDEIVQLEARSCHLASQLQRLRLHLRWRGGIRLNLRRSLPPGSSAECLRPPAAGRPFGIGACVAEQRAA
eukprot:scaffold6718_cov66-Phaeocystis_antarctica.AAC.4